MSMSKDGERKLTWQTADPDDCYGVAAKPLTAGRELDALVAEKIMVWTRGHDGLNERWYDATGAVVHYVNRVPEGLATVSSFTPSTDIRDAWLVVEKLRSQEYGVILSDVRAHFWTCELDRSDWRGSEVWTGETAPLCICRAALAALRASQDR